MSGVAHPAAFLLGGGRRIFSSRFSKDDSRRASREGEAQHGEENPRAAAAFLNREKRARNPFRCRQPILSQKSYARANVRFSIFSARGIDRSRPVLGGASVSVYIVFRLGGWREGQFRTCVARKT